MHVHQCAARLSWTSRYSRYSYTNSSFSALVRMNSVSSSSVNLSPISVTSIASISAPTMSGCTASPLPHPSRTRQAHASHERGDGGADLPSMCTASLTETHAHAYGRLLQRAASHASRTRDKEHHLRSEPGLLEVVLELFERDEAFAVLVQ
jgi:hypothetical protein